MTTTTPVLGLIVDGSDDQFSHDDFENNWDTLDSSPGVYVCTSSTHPTGWGSDQAGRLIVETDTGDLYRWNGTTFVPPLTGLYSGSGQLAGGPYNLAANTASNCFAFSSLAPGRYIINCNYLVAYGGGATGVLIATYDVSSGTIAFTGGQATSQGLDPSVVGTKAFQLSIVTFATVTATAVIEAQIFNADASVNATLLQEDSSTLGIPTGYTVQQVG